MSSSEGLQPVGVQAAPVLVSRDDNRGRGVPERLRQLQGLGVFRDVPLSEINPVCLQDLLRNAAWLASGRTDDYDH